MSQYPENLCVCVCVSVCLQQFVAPCLGPAGSSSPSEAAATQTVPQWFHTKCLKEQKQHGEDFQLLRVTSCSSGKSSH